MLLFIQQICILCVSKKYTFLKIEKIPITNIYILEWHVKYFNKGILTRKIKTM